MNDIIFTYQPGEDYKILTITSAGKGMEKREAINTDGGSDFFLIN